MYDKGTVSFSQILDGLLAKAHYNSNLESRQPVLQSFREFLYGSNGLSKNFSNWTAANPNFADFITNPEVALINHIRNTVKNIYKYDYEGEMVIIKNEDTNQLVTPNHKCVVSEKDILRLEYAEKIIGRNIEIDRKSTRLNSSH